MRPSEVLTKDERTSLMEKSDWVAMALIARTWVAIFGLLWIAGTWPSLLTAFLVWVLLPGRQLSLAVLMHEAGHGSLFRSPALNRWAG